jgi:hypothetical protein
MTREQVEAEIPATSSRGHLARALALHDRGLRTHGGK